MMARKYVKAYFDWNSQMSALSDAEKGRLFTAILEYGRSGCVPTMPGREGILFPVFQSQIDRDEQNYQTTIANGRMGGAPKGNTNAAKITGGSQKQPKPTKNNQDKDKDKDKEKRIPPKSPQGDLQGELVKSSLPDDVKAALSEWLDYKRERMEKYTLTGWKKLLAVTARQIGDHRESDVISLIEESMANGWQGIIWDRLKRGERQNRADAPPDPAPAPTPEYIPPAPEMDEYRVLLDPDKPFHLDDFLP